MMEVVKSYVGELVGLVNEMAPYLLLGFLFAGILRVFFPQRIIARYMGKHNFRSVLNASLLGVPMPLCSCGVLPTGIGFYKNGASRGSTISFMISTPQTGVDSILATYSLLGLPMGKKSLWIYLVSIIGGALFFGTLINELVPREWIMSSIPLNLHGEMHEHPAGWLQWISSAVLVLLIINGYIIKYLSRRKNRIEDKTKSKQMKSYIHTIRVEGMTCNHCKASVENGLKNNPFISEVLADPDMNTVTIRAETLTDSNIRETVEGLGYNFKGRI